MQLVARAVGGGADVYVRSPRMRPHDMSNRHSVSGSIRSFVELERELRQVVKEPHRSAEVVQIQEVPVTGAVLFSRSCVEGTSSMHQVDALLHPQYRLQRVGGFEDGSDGLTFARLVSEIQPMILLCLVLVRCADGAARGHIIVIDTWRSLVFLGAGDPDVETLVGVKGITAEDRVGDRGLDQAMEALGVTRLQAVRALWEHVPSQSGKLSAHQRRKRQRERERSA